MAHNELTLTEPHIHVRTRIVIELEMAIQHYNGKVVPCTWVMFSTVAVKKKVPTLIARITTPYVSYWYRSTHCEVRYESTYIIGMRCAVRGVVHYVNWYGMARNKVVSIIKVTGDSLHQET